MKLFIKQVDRRHDRQKKYNHLPQCRKPRDNVVLQQLADHVEHNPGMKGKSLYRDKMNRRIAHPVRE